MRSLSGGRRMAWIAAAGVHLALVICGAAGYTPVSPRHLAGRVIETYREFTGANNGYGFFAPGVASEWRATFDICGAGMHCMPAAEEQVGREARLLLVTIDGLLGESDLRDLLAASYAARQFARFPHAEVVLVKVEVFALPSMAQYRGGRRPQWRKIYGFAFHRAADGRR
jgi:hypothetical protein